MMVGKHDGEVLVLMFVPNLPIRDFAHILYLLQAYEISFAEGHVRPSVNDLGRVFLPCPGPFAVTLRPAGNVGGSSAI